MVEEVDGGGGTKVVCEGLLGSSKVGGGKIGLLATFPVPDGPPPPTRLLVFGPELLLAAAAICCWCLAKTSRPLVTYPACISCFVNVSSVSPMQ